MKNILVLFFLCINLLAVGQDEKSKSVSVSYFGELITHPGVRVNLDLSFKTWSKTKETRKGVTKTIHKDFIISPSIGFFYHRRYQTGVFAIPEVKYHRQNQKGGFYELGIGVGYLRTFIPNTYELNASGELEKVIAGHNYFVSNYFVSFGKDLSVNGSLPFAYFIKPQFMYALPNFPNGTGYFALELGIRMNLN